MKTETVSNSTELILAADKADLADKAARTFARLVSECLKLKQTCSVALSGGSTPSLLYDRLRQADLLDSIPWSKIVFFVSDERCVDHESTQSNYGNAFRKLLEPLNLASSNLHPTEGQDKNATESAANYEKLIRTLVDTGASGVPRFDIIFLGMGPDGHTASLFPDSPALKEDGKLVSSNFITKLSSERITFTFKLINNAANVIFLVAGKDKSDVLTEVFESEEIRYPVQQVNPVNGKLFWFVDRDAAEKLEL